VSHSSLPKPTEMKPDEPLISVCVCTFKRPRLLANLLTELGRKITQGNFSYSIIVVDNDSTESARAIVESFRTRLPVPVEYDVEPVQNISLARNRAVARARSDMVAFIDDDELPTEDWLLKLYMALCRSGADGVLGPVISVFEVVPPKWVLTARVFERPLRPAGEVVHWTQGRTGNVLLRHSVLDEVEGPFRRECGSGGEDQDFFKRAIDKGRVFVWCQQASVNETVPSHRLRRSFQLRKALLRGKASLASPQHGPAAILKSIVATFLYTICLPVFLLFGQRVFMKYLIKDFDHIGRLLAVCGIDPVRQKYITE